MYAYKGTFSAATSTGNQTITGIVDENGNSFTPKAVFIWSTFGTSAAYADGWTYYMGATDGTTSMAGCSAASDNVAAQRSNSVRSTNLVRIINSAGTALRVGDFSSFGSGQFVINWTTVTASAEIFHYIAFGGTDLTVNASSFRMDLEATRTPVVLPLAGVLNFVGYGSPSIGGGPSIGWWVPKSTGAIDQGAACNNIRDNVNPSKTASYQRTDQFKAQHTATSDLGLFIAAGMDVLGEFRSVTGSSSNVVMQTLAFSGIVMAAGNGLQPTSTGTQAISGLGFRPKAILFVSTGKAASTSASAEARMSIGGADRTRQGHAIAGSLSGVTPSVAVTYEDTSKIVSCITPNATAASTTTEAQASIQSIDSDGFTLNWTAADATQREYLWLAFGDAAAASGGEKSTTFVGMI